MIAITFALPAESRGFACLISGKAQRDIEGVTVITGTIDNRPIELLHTGVGERICRQRMAGFLHDRQFDYLISAGFAGALTDQLNVGDVLLARNFSTLHLRERPSRFVHADLHTAPAIIDSPLERKKLAQATGALAVDMETEFIARACTDHALPMMSLRVISDTPTIAIPAPPDVLFDVINQRTNYAKLAAFFLAHPARLPGLIRFARRIERVRNILANAIVGVIREGRVD